MVLRGLLRRMRRRQASLRLYWLTSDLAFSRAPLAHEWQELKQAGIRCAIDLRAEAESKAAASASGVDYHRLPVLEGGVPSDDDLLGLTGWIADNIASIRPVLIYCREGLGRSPLVACAALVRLGMPLPEAYAALRRARESVALSDEQARTLERFAGQVAISGRKGVAG